MNSPKKAHPGLAPRERAHTIIHEVLDRRRPFDEVQKSDQRFAKLETRDRAFARNLIATVLRRLGQIDAIIDDCLNRPLPRSAAAARNALRLGICQILFLDTQTHAAVDTSVTLAARRGPDRFRGVVNAILRRVARGDADALKQKFGDHLNVPDWLGKSWETSFGTETAAAIARTHLLTPPLDLTAAAEADSWAEKLGGERIGTSTVRVTGGGDVTTLDGYADGAWWVQDAAAALPATLLLNSLSGGSVCDLCAAPGGKTAQLAAAGLQVTAADASATRLGILSKNMARLKLSAAVVEADILTWEPEAQFDGVLLDAPCTATGTIRRHPDIPHLKKAADVSRQADLQKKLLDRAAEWVRPGGVLVYSVCSLEPGEGRDQISALLARTCDLELLPPQPGDVADFEACVSEDGLIQTTPAHLGERGGVDGFFVARLRKKETV